MSAFYIHVSTTKIMRSPHPPPIPNTEVLMVTQSLQLKWPADIVCWKVCLPGLCVASKLWVWYPPCWQRFQFTSDETGSDHMFWNGNNIKTALSAGTLWTPDQGLPLLENPFPETPSVISPCKWTLEKRTTPLQKQLKNPFCHISMQMNLWKKDHTSSKTFLEIPSILSSCRWTLKKDYRSSKTISSNLITLLCNESLTPLSELL